MNFERLRTVGVAVTAGAIMTLAGTVAQANNTQTWSNAPTTPTVQVVINQVINEMGTGFTGYDVELSTSNGFADYLGLGFNWSGTPALTFGSFSNVQGYGKTNQPVTTNFQLCTNANQCGPQPNNFLNTYDYVLSFGGVGANPYINKVDFRIASTAGWNPFEAFEARGQNLQDENGDQVLVAGADGDLSDSFKFVLCENGCGPSGEEPSVPEISATGSVAALGSVLALMAFLLERRGGFSMRRRSVA